MSEHVVPLSGSSRSVGVRTPNQKGAIAEMAIAYAAAKLDIPVLRPLAEVRYDLVFDLGHRFVRVQCKWARRAGEIVIVNLTSSRITTRGAVRTTYGVHEIDAVAAYCVELEQCYLLPVELVAGLGAISLRLSPPRNAQRAWIHWASDFHLPGAIAQLGERRRGTPEAGGSSPPSSTLSTEVGAHEFRERMGWYFERVVDGERFLITRWGKPFARLEPAVDGSDRPQALREGMDPLPQRVGPADLELASGAGEETCDPVQ
jgi:antitoxin (DNA-binding transcriptional repressor) of toxin-antitoxin stability system